MDLKKNIILFFVCKGCHARCYQNIHLFSALFPPLYLFLSSLLSHCLSVSSLSLFLPFTILLSFSLSITLHTHSLSLSLFLFLYLYLSLPLSLSLSLSLHHSFLSVSHTLSISISLYLSLLYLSLSLSHLPVAQCEGGLGKLKQIVLILSPVEKSYVAIKHFRFY